MNALKIHKAGYVLTLTEIGRDRLLFILDSWTDVMEQYGTGKYSGNAYAAELRFAKKLEQILINPRRRKAH